MKIAIVGAGKLGLKVAEALLGGNHTVTVIDKNHAVLEKLSSNMDIMTLNENGKEIKALRSIDIETYDFLVATTDSDEKNIVIASFAKKLGCSKVIARVRDPEHMSQLDFIKDSMSIDYIVNPDLSITIEIYKFLVEKYSLSNGIFTSGKVSLLEFSARKFAHLADLKLTNFNTVLPGMLVVALSRNGKVIVPTGNTVILKDDIIYVMGEKSAILALSNKVKGKHRDYAPQKAMILGGGKTGLYLALKLSEFGIAVKVIEKNKERCHYLSAHLNDVMVLHGDATDLTLLEDENLEDMDAFITATGYDEENLLLALMAKRKGIADVIAKVSKKSYADLIESMGIDMALNPLDITASNILRFMQGSKRVISSQLIQGQAEIMEIIADDTMPLANKHLKDLNLPNGMIIAGIHRGTKAIVPNGNTTILDGDKVIIIYLLSEMAVLENLIRSKRKAF